LVHVWEYCIIIPDLGGSKKRTSEI
jgi:hypothetical protein